MAILKSSPLISAVQQMRRKIRNPQHRFYLRVRPWEIQPCLLAPVLPGETMKNLLLQSRVVTKPIKNALIGWWAEYYIFYVKIRDLAARDAWQAMFLNPEADMSAQNAAASVPNYHFGSYPDFAQQCLVEVVENYFRDEGEAWNVATIGANRPAATIGQNSWLDSVINAADMAEDDFSIDLNANATITASETQQALRMFEFLQQQKLTTQTYEEFLSTYGVRPRKEESHVPELVRYVRDWTYPSNAVEPTTGVPSSAASWAVSARADKDRYFREPGFLFGVQVVRPKVYLNNLVGSAADLLNSATAWLPAVLHNDSRASMVNVPDNAGPLGNITDTGGAWIDIRDLFMYGDQFVNFAFDGTVSEVDLPTAALQKKYPSGTDADGLFVGGTAATRLVESDGVVSLSIATALEDTSETSVNVM